jgi:hypothetical protein
MQNNAEHELSWRTIPDVAYSPSEALERYRAGCSLWLACGGFGLWGGVGGFGWFDEWLFQWGIARVGFVYECARCAYFCERDGGQWQRDDHVYRAEFEWRIDDHQLYRYLRCAWRLRYGDGHGQSYYGDGPDEWHDV